MVQPTLFSKIDVIQQKINQLNAEKLKIEQQLSLELVNVLKKTGATNIDFDILIGGILDVIKSIQSKSRESEVWQQAGQKFRGVKVKKTKSAVVKQSGTA